MNARARPWIGRLAVIAASLVAIVLIWKLLPVQMWLSTAVWRMFDLGMWGVLIYFLLYLLLASLTFPITPLNVGAGILFPFWLGAVVAVVAAFVTSAGSFLFARYVAGDKVRLRLSKLPNFDNVMKLLDDAGVKVVFLVRLNPFIPASLKNYGFSLTGISLKAYLLGTALGQTPVTLAHVYLGWAGGVRDDGRRWRAERLALYLHRRGRRGQRGITGAHFLVRVAQAESGRQLGIALSPSAGCRSGRGRSRNARRCEPLC